MSVAFRVSPALQRIGQTSEEAVKDAMEDITADLLKTATQRTPYKKGGLEQSGRATQVTRQGTAYSSQVSFSVEGNGRYNYARKMNDDTYNLGAGSLQKNSGGVNSFFSDKTMRVGKGYLTDTAQSCKAGYNKYIKSQLINAIK